MAKIKGLLGLKKEKKNDIVTTMKKSEKRNICQDRGNL